MRNSNINPETLTPEWRTWKHIIQLCTNPNTSGRSYYYDKGIKLDDLFMPDPASKYKAIKSLPRGYVNFLKCVGRKPGNAYYLARIDKTGNYMPGNIKWMTFGEALKHKSWNRFGRTPDETLIKELQARGYNVTKT